MRPKGRKRAMREAVVETRPGSVGIRIEGDHKPMELVDLSVEEMPSRPVQKFWRKPAWLARLWRWVTR